MSRSVMLLSPRQHLYAIQDETESRNYTSCDAVADSVSEIQSTMDAIM
jgi:hypothetical protein